VVLAEHSAANQTVVLDLNVPAGWGLQKAHPRLARVEAFCQVDSLPHSAWLVCQEALAGREVARLGRLKDAKFLLRFCREAGLAGPPVFAAAVRKKLAEEVAPFLRRLYG
jgi:hypothetical protein